MTIKKPQAGYRLDYSTFQPKHKLLMTLAEDHRVQNLMAAGGIRSGKTIAEIAIIIRRALEAPGSRHAFCHGVGKVCKANLFDYSVPMAFEILMPGYWDNEIVKRDNINISDRVITLPGGSKFLFYGLDDASKLRGQEFCTVMVNEANRFVSYEDITLLQGRLTQTSYKITDGSPLKHLMLVDLNPTIKSSWDYQTFKLKKIPGDGSPLPNRKAWQHVVINAIDNKANLPEGTLDRLFAGMPERQRAAEERGEWLDDNPNALFDATKIGRKTIHPEDCIERVVSLDPAGTSHNKSDSTGLIVAGKGADGLYYVFEDATMQGKPTEWIKQAEELRIKYDAHWIISEKDYARDILVELIERTIPCAPVKYVESRGMRKRLRAEPIAALYERGLVNHTKPFRELEQQMIEFDSEGFRGSPDRVDALVYALQHLSGVGQPVMPLTVRKVGGYFR